MLSVITLAAHFHGLLCDGAKIRIFLINSQKSGQKVCRFEENV